MTLTHVVIFKCPGELKAELEKTAAKLGISQSAIARNSLAIALLPPEKPRKPSQLELVLERARKEFE